MISVDCFRFAFDFLLLATVVLVQITLVTALAGMLARRAYADPARRHGILLAAVVFVSACPLEVWVVQSTRLCVLAIPPEISSIGSDATKSSAGALEPQRWPSVSRASEAVIGDGTSTVPSAAAQSFRESPQMIPSSTSAKADAKRIDGRPLAAANDPATPRDWLGTAAVVAMVSWGLGSLLLTLRLGYGWWLLARLRRRAVPVPQGLLDGHLDAIRCELGMKCLPWIGVCPELAGPAAVGILHPVVLLPPSLLDVLDQCQLRDVLMHECAHVARRDPWVGLLQRVVELVFWFHPLVHWVNRELSRAREEVCDNFVLKHGDRVAYGRLLLCWSEEFNLHVRAGMIGMFRGPGSLERRIAGLLNPERSLNTAGSHWVVSGWTALFLAVALPLAGIRAASALAQAGVIAPASHESEDPSAAPILAKLARLGATWQLDSSGQPRSISLDDTKATDVDLATLARLPSLTDLSLRNTTVTDAGLRHLAGLVQLQNLNLAGTRITNAGLPHLRGLTQLTSLGVADTAVTAEGLTTIDGHQEHAEGPPEPSGGLGGSGGGGFGGAGLF